MICPGVVAPEEEQEPPLLRHSATVPAMWGEAMLVPEIVL
jgi:hypothetical protein